MKPTDQFPTHVIYPDRELYRIHRAIHDPLHYSAASERPRGGRFDLPAAAGSGTCYLATSPVGALLETFGRFRAVTTEMIDERRLTVLTPTSPLKLADLTDRSTLGDYGITGDISTGTDYQVSQDWAVQLWEAGFDGIYYAARHDPQFTERSAAVFGRNDQALHGRDKRFEVVTTSIPAQLLTDLQSEFGILLLPSEPLADRDLLPPSS